MSKSIVAQQVETSNFLPSAQGIFQRKCACGNQTVGGGECAECGEKKLGLQRKLTIGESNDSLEREADRVADQVLSMPINSNIGRVPPRIQRFMGQSAVSSQIVAPASVDRVLTNSGRPLEANLQLDMEQRFGRDFSQVRVHSGPAAEQSARDVKAHAYTVGNNIVFGAGRFASKTHEGQRLLAHELTHVVQQNDNQKFLQRFVESTEPNSYIVQGVSDAVDVVNVITGTGYVRGAIVASCLLDLEEPMGRITLTRWIPRACRRSTSIYLHSRDWDAFGHCWIGCEGSRQCGRGATAIAGVSREIYRELQDVFGGDPHDSFSQDMNNQSRGRGLSFTAGTCFSLCNSAYESGSLDLTAPQRVCANCTTSPIDIDGPCS